MFKLERLFWESDLGRNLDYTKIKYIYSDNNQFRVTQNKYKAGEVIHGNTIAGCCFVLSGKCRYYFDQYRITLQKGEYTGIPAGTYRLEMDKGHNAEIINIWELPFCALDEKANRV